MLPRVCGHGFRQGEPNRAGFAGERTSPKLRIGERDRQALLRRRESVNSVLFQLAEVSATRESQQARGLGLVPGTLTQSGEQLVAFPWRGEVRLERAAVSVM